MKKHCFRGRMHKFQSLGWQMGYFDVEFVLVVRQYVFFLFLCLGDFVHFVFPSDPNQPKLVATDTFDVCFENHFVFTASLDGF